jgi:protein-S-isoprenylcysteine O-methyltransferase
MTQKISLRMNSTANGTVHHEGEPSISWPINRPSRDSRVDPFSQIHAGGLGSAPEFAVLPDLSEESRERYEKQYLPGQPKSLSCIAIRAFLLGLVLSASLISTICTVSFTQSPLWRIPCFIATLSIFHFLEFWTTARYNARSAQVSSFLLSQNGSAYNIAHTGAMIECLLTNVLFPNRSWPPPYLANVLVILGFVMVLVGQAIRSIAMVQAGTNFNHIVQHHKANEHQLVTSGAYGYLRHPSYFGFFWWGLGTQIMLGNVVCFLGYAAVLWKFFSRRISGELYFQFFRI